MVVLMIFAFVLGVLTILAVEALGVVVLIRWLNRKVEKEESKVEASEPSPPVQLDPSYYNKQGFLWVLEPEKIPKGWHLDKVSRDQKPKKSFIEVVPVRKPAKVKDHSLILTEPDGSHTKISLKGCIISAVSATGLPSRKWAKRFPIQVKNKKTEIYKGCKAFYVYLETSWEKESWCKALRLASCDDKEKLKWIAKLNVEFHNYLTSLNAEYPSFMKPSLGVNADLGDKSMKIDGASSKVRQFLKKLQKKAAKSGEDTKTGSTSMSSHEYRKIAQKCYSFEEPALAAMSRKMVPTPKPPSSATEGSMFLSSRSTSSTSSGGNQMSLISDGDLEDKISFDEGTLCWNLLISRFFFDAKSNLQMKTALQSRIQRTLSNMRTPSYVGEVICTSLDTGNLPPYIHGMRILPSDMNEVWAMEIDIEYAGGVVLGIETRLEVRELDSQEGEEANLESSSVGEVTPDLLEGIEYFGKQLNLSEDTVSEIEQKDEKSHKSDDNRSSKITTRRLSSQVPRWKSILQSVAKQVSQVPLSLAIKVAYLRGTVRLYIKPPPSDQLWFGFTSMPHIDFDLEPSVGEHKVTSGQLALFLISRFKTAIRETMVLPNCENAYVPWMIAEEDDWVPPNVAPFIWISHDVAANATTKQEAPISQMGDVPSTVDDRENPSACHDEKHDKSEDKHDKLEKDNTHDKSEKSNTLDKSEKVGSSPHPTGESVNLRVLSAPVTRTTSNDNSLQDLRTPLLKSNEPQEISRKSPEERRESQLRSQSVSLTDEQSQTDDDDTRPKRIGTKARMLGLGKKMGEKLEEKRRHLEEKGRNIVEKMRERN